MKHLKNLALVFFAGLSLAACSSFGDRESVDTAGVPRVQAIDLMQGGAPVDIDPAEAIARNTDGRVQIFSLDGGGVPAYRGGAYPASGDAGIEVAPVRAVPVSGGGEARVFSGDPSVQVFPLDDFSPGVAVSGGAGRGQEGFDTSGAAIIYFGHDSETLSAEALETLRRISRAFDPALGQGIDVEGHASITANYADEAQRKIVNLKVSMDRAMAVSRALIRQGVPAEAIRVTAWGETRPPRRFNGKTPEEAARRVEVSGPGVL